MSAPPAPVTATPSAPPLAATATATATATAAAAAAAPTRPSPALPRPRSPTIDLPTKRRRKQNRTASRSKPRRDNRKSRFAADYTPDDERHNAHLSAYYLAQGIVPPAEFPALMASLATPLPTSFRITADGQRRDDILARLRGEMNDLFEGMGEEKGVKPPRAMPWYPHELAWTVSAPRQMLRRDNVLAPFHKFLVQMNDIGGINRQEAVSMIPPLMLDVRAGEAVIDLCAAPGSKTAQILEMASGPGAASNGVPALKRGGLVIANDADIRRCWMLSHQLKRFASPDLVVTHHDAQFFPKIMMFDRVLCDVPCTGDGTLRKAPDIWRRWTPDMGIGIHRLQRQILERGLDILKPGGRLVYSTCSMNPLENEAVVAHALRKYGDDIELRDMSDMLPGLLRRPGLRTWKVKDNSSNVDARAKDVVDVTEEDKVPGAEVAEAREDRTEGANGDENSELKANRTASSSGWFESYDAVPQRRRKKIVQSLFPPSAEELSSGKFPLERCMRLVPHDQDTGAFFVSVLVKKVDARVHKKLQQTLVAEAGDEATGADPTGAADQAVGKNVAPDLKSEDAVTVGATRETDATSGQPNKITDGAEADCANGKDETEGKAQVAGKGKQEHKARRGGTRLITDDPLVSVGELNKEMLENMSDFFGIDRAISATSFMTRGGDKTTFKRVVAVSPRVRELLRHSLGSREAAGGGGLGGLGGRPEAAKVRVVNAGVRVLERTDRRDTTCPFRLIHEGLDLVVEVMQARLARTPLRAAIAQLVGADSVKLDAIQCAELQRQLAAMSSGSCVVELQQGAAAVERVVAWKGRSSVAAVMPKEHVDALRTRVGHEA